MNDGGDAGPVAMRPIDTDAPGASAAFQSGAVAVAVAVAPDWLTVTFQAWSIDVDPRSCQLTVHGERTPVPVSVTVIAAFPVGIRSLHRPGGPGVWGAGRP